jgi:hypothetical protein
MNNQSRVRDKLKNTKFGIKLEDWNNGLNSIPRLVVHILLLLIGGIVILIGLNIQVLIIQQIGLSLGCVLIVTSFSLAIQDKLYSHRYMGIKRPPPHVYLSHVKSELNLMGITLHDFQKDKKFVEQLMKIASASKEPNAKRYVDFKFLMLFPLSDEFKNRGMEEKKEEKLRAEAHISLRELTNLRKDILLLNSNNKCEIKIYNVPPRRSMIITDDNVFIGPYFYGRPGTESKWIGISNSRLSSEYVEEFNSIWKDEKKSQIYEYDKYNYGEFPIENGYKDLIFS